MEDENNNEGHDPENTEGIEGGAESGGSSEGGDLSLQIPESQETSGEGGGQVGQIAPERLEAFTQEIITNGGSLGEDSMKELEGLGYSRELVEGYVAGQWAQRQAQIASVYSALGGEGNVKRALNFAAGLPEGERASIQRDLDTASPETQVTIMQGLLARAGHRTTLKATGGKSDDGIKPFANHTEYHAAIEDPEYNRSQEYRDKVMARLRISPNV